VDFSGINIWELIVASFSTFVVGFLWYGNFLFGKSWQKLAGLSDEDIAKGNMVLIYGLAFILNFIAAAFISIFAEIAMMLGTSAILAGLFAVVLCIGFVATSFGVNFLFTRKPLKLYLIDVGYMVVSFFVMGVIIGAWR
jgi:hypothetical protein